MKKTRPTKTTERIHGISIYHTIPIAAAQKQFIETAKGKDSEPNSYLEKFVQAGDTLLANSRTVCLEDFLFALRAFDVPNLETIRLFNLWAAKMVQLSKIERLEHSCYDGDTYLVNS